MYASIDLTIHLHIYTLSVPYFTKSPSIHPPSTHPFICIHPYTAIYFYPDTHLHPSIHHHKHPLLSFGVKKGNQPLHPPIKILAVVSTSLMCPKLILAFGPVKPNSLFMSTGVNWQKYYQSVLFEKFIKSLEFPLAAWLVTIIRYNHSFIFSCRIQPVIKCVWLHYEEKWNMERSSRAHHLCLETFYS